MEAGEELAELEVQFTWLATGLALTFMQMVVWVVWEVMVITAGVMDAVEGRD
jgi:hypothetical protein